jgi:indole-3-glycerol phosphate synthase
MKTYLDEIIEWHRNGVKPLELNENEILRLASKSSGARKFSDAIKSDPNVSIIAEIKKKSPSLGYLQKDILVGKQAINYKLGGAKCISILTDTKFFDGKKEDLIAVKAAVDLPLLRKDFIVRRSDLFESKLIGADAVLLIVAALSDNELKSFLSISTDLNLEALVEVHDLEELDRALSAGAEMVGVNQRDLYTFEVDRTRAVKLVSQIPENILKVAESGIKERLDIKVLSEAGFDAVLIGEVLMKSADPKSLLENLLIS